MFSQKLFYIFLFIGFLNTKGVFATDHDMVEHIFHTLPVLREALEEEAFFPSSETETEEEKE